MKFYEINNSTLSEWVKENDFAFLYGAGKMYANDPDTKEWLADIIDRSNRIEPVYDNNIIGTSCEELSDEDGLILAVYDDNNVALYIACYDVDKLTYDVHFNDSSYSDSEGINSSYDCCMDWIECNRNDDLTYFGDYKGGTVSIVCNETGKTLYEEEIKSLSLSDDTIQLLEDNSISVEYNCGGYNYKIHYPTDNYDYCNTEEEVLSCVKEYIEYWDNKINK